MVKGFSGRKRLPRCEGDWNRCWHILGRSCKYRMLERVPRCEGIET